MGLSDWVCPYRSCLYWASRNIERSKTESTCGELNSFFSFANSFTTPQLSRISPKTGVVIVVLIYYWNRSATITYLRLDGKLGTIFPDYSRLPAVFIWGYPESMRGCTFALRLRESRRYIRVFITRFTKAWSTYSMWDIIPYVIEM